MVAEYIIKTWCSGINVYDFNYFIDCTNVQGMMGGGGGAYFLGSVYFDSGFGVHI